MSGGAAPARSPSRIRYRHGTHRALHPRETLVRIGPAAEACGITRLADVTGLDRIGIPVFQAIRPLGRSVSVSQGKGATAVSARVSALMEGIELHHAERVEPDGLDAATGQPWCAAVELGSGRRARVPHAAVSMDLCIPAEGGSGASSNGLASGNTLAEATVAALCEVIERDAQARWAGRGTRHRLRTAIDPETIDDRGARLLLALIRRAGLAFRLWSMGAEHGIPVIACAILELESDRAIVLQPAFGAGAHPVSSVALLRAITEAAQTRATLIAGARDDCVPADYADPAGMRFRLLIDGGLGHDGGIAWPSMAGIAYDDHDAMIDGLLECCRMAGATDVFAVDLTDPALAVPVVKVVVPGFADHGQVRAGGLTH